MNLIGIFVEYPWLALVPGIALAVVGSRQKRTVVLVAAAAWLLYSAYETAMTRRILCSGECNIRVDLLLIYPVLALLTLTALVSALQPRRRGT